MKRILLAILFCATSAFAATPFGLSVDKNGNIITTNLPASGVVNFATGKLKINGVDVGSGGGGLTFTGTTPVGGEVIISDESDPENKVRVATVADVAQFANDQTAIAIFDKDAGVAGEWKRGLLGPAFHYEASGNDLLVTLMGAEIDWAGADETIPLADVSGLSAALDAKADAATTVSGYGITDAAPAILIRHKDGTSTAYQPASNTDAARGTALLTAAATLVSGDALSLGGGTFNLNGTQLLIPDGAISVSGAGIDVTIITIGSDSVSSGYAILKVGTGNVISDLTVDESANPANANAPIGFKSTSGDSVATSFTLKRVKAVGNNDSFRFIGGATAFDGVMIDCVSRSLWDGLSVATVSTTTLGIYNPDFVSTANPTSNAINAATISSGKITISGGRMVATGSLVGNTGLSTSGTVTVSGTAFTTSGTAAYDIKQTSGTLTVGGGSGSGTNGALVTSGTIAYVNQPYDADLTTWAGVTPGTGVAAALGVNIGSAGAPVLFNGAGGTPSSMTGTNIIGIPESGVTNLTGDLALKAPLASPTFTGTVTLPSGQALIAPALGTPASGNFSSGTFTWPTFNQNTSGNAATVTTNANLTGAVTSSGNATSLGSFTSAALLGALSDETGTGKAVFATSPSITTGINDANGNSMLAFTATASAVNGLTLVNSATGGEVFLTMTGSDAQSTRAFRIGTGTSGSSGAEMRMTSGLFEFARADRAFSVNLDVSTTPGIKFSTTNNSSSEIRFNAVNGLTIQSAASTATWNDSSTASSGTVANRYIFGVPAPTLTASNSSVTDTVASTVYIGGAPTASTNTTITTPYALNVAAGVTKFGGGTVILPPYTVATLPSTAATGMVTGAMAYVTDATAPTYNGALTGSGAVVVPVFYNGSAWVSH